MTPSQAALDELRQQIDRIDDQIHDLLMQRAGLAHQVASAKGREALMWRPQREAGILRRLARRHRGPFPRAAMVRIWREIMAAMLSLEAPFTVAVCAAPNQPGFWDRARDHFGTCATISAFQGAGAVMRAVTDDPRTIGVLPWPREDDPEPWWPYLMGDDASAPRIVARLPFLDGDPALGALAIARATFEPSGDDRSFLGIETTEPISRTRFLSRLTAAGCDVGFITTHAERGDQTARRHLVELVGFVGPDDPRLDAIRESAPEVIARVSWLGGYAVALEPVKTPGKG